MLLKKFGPGGPPQGVPTPALPGSGSWVGSAPAPPSQPSSAITDRLAPPVTLRIKRGWRGVKQLFARKSQVFIRAAIHPSSPTPLKILFSRSSSSSSSSSISSFALDRSTGRERWRRHGLRRQMLRLGQPRSATAHALGRCPHRNPIVFIRIHFWFNGRHGRADSTSH